jgi:hypothetical protein
MKGWYWPLLPSPSAEVRNLPERNLAVELLEGEIKSKFGGNVSARGCHSDGVGTSGKFER